MDSDATLDGEVDHSFFDSDAERLPRALGQGQEQDQEPGQDEEYSRAVSSSRSPTPTSSLSSGRAGGLPRYRTRSPDYGSDSSKSRSSNSNSSSRDEAGDRGSRSRSPSPRTVPVTRWLHSRAGQPRDDPLSDSDTSSSSGRRLRARPSAKTRTGRSHHLCRPKKRLPESAASTATGTRRLPEDEESTEVTDVTPLSSPVQPVGCQRPRSRPSLRSRLSPRPNPRPRRGKSSKKQENVSQAVYNSLDRLSVGREKGQGVQKARKLKKPREGKSCILNCKPNSLEYKRPEQRLGQKILNDASDLNQLLREQRQRKNYTFTNEEAKRIDRENQRLLHELTRKATRPPVKPKKISAETVRVYHSALNRQREQERIERENLAFLKRLEAVKPTVGLKRSTQLYDYQRQMAFMESYSQHSRPSTRGSMSRLSSRSSVHKHVHAVSN
ncbi:cilia- and flagella-associated protein 97 isoform X2 [Rhinoraja longicauda]